MKKVKKSQEIIEELSRLPNVSIVCERVGISRQSLYRWMREDDRFCKAVNDAMELGTSSINDLAEGKLISHIKEGKQRSIEYWLRHNKHNYMSPKPKDFWDKIFTASKSKPYETLFFVDKNGEVTYKGGFEGLEKERKMNIRDNNPEFKKYVKDNSSVVVKFKSFGVEVKPDEEIK